MRRFVACFLFAALAVPALAEDWPTWRGVKRDDLSAETGLLKTWPKDGPKRLWLSEDAGLGYSGFAIVGDKLYTMGLDGETEQMLCLSVADGKTLWKAKVGDRLENGWGDGPRGTPTVDGDLVYGMGGQGVLTCVAAADGAVKWEKSMKELGGGKPSWGYCESVTIDGDSVVCTPGGSKGAIAALNKKTGELVWQSTDVTDGAQYASLLTETVNGKKQFIQLFTNKFVGVETATGKLIWSSDWVGKTAVIPTPIYHDGFVYISSGYGAGCKLVKLNDSAEPEVVYENKNMKNHHGGVILVGDKLYGHSDGVGWICQDFKTGEIVWSDKQSLGKGCVAYADGMLYCVDETKGVVVLIKASPEGWSEQGRFTLEPQTKKRNPKGRIWTHPVIANGKLYLRDQELLSCYDVKQ